MRKQYHLKKSQNGFNAWDVDLLMEKSKNLEIKEINLDNIRELDENFWYLDSKKIPTCRSIADHMKLVNETDLHYPIILSKDGKVMDGMHRVVKAYLLGNKSIKAVRFQSDIKPDFFDIQTKNLKY